MHRIQQGQQRGQRNPHAPPHLLQHTPARGHQNGGQLAAWSRTRLTACPFLCRRSKRAQLDATLVLRELSREANNALVGPTVRCFEAYCICAAQASATSTRAVDTGYCTHGVLVQINKGERYSQGTPRRRTCPRRWTLHRCPYRE